MAIFVQLPTGKTIMLTLEKYLSLTDEELQGLIADDKGTFIDDPFTNSYAPLYLEIEEDEKIDDNIPPDEIYKIFNNNDG